VDVDLYVPRAEDSLEELHRLGLDRYTITCLTGGGGRHLYYRAPVPVPSRPLDGYPGVDVKGDGGMVIVPPSIHPSGKRYDWEFAFAPGEAAASLIPANVLDLFGAGHANPAGDLDERDEEAVNLLLDHFGGHTPRQRDGYVEVTRPGKPDGASATVGAVGRGTTRVWSTHRDGLPAGVYGLAELRQRAGVEQHHEFRIPTRDDEATPAKFIPLSDVRSRRQRWLWSGIVPAGQLELVIGQEKLGKSSAMVWVGARVTRGELDGDLKGEPGTVVFVSAEDAADTVLKARAVAAGADPDRFYVLNPQGDGFSLDAVLELDPRLVVLDPFSAFVELPKGGDEPGEVALRRSFLPFHLLAVEYDVTVAGVRHVRKAPGTSNPFDVALGSRAWTAAARAVLFFTPDKTRGDDKGGLLFARGNLAAGTAYRWHLTPKVVRLDDDSVGEVPLFVLDGAAADVSLEELLADADSVGELERAKDFLRFHLAEDGASGLGRPSAR
jgi:hypothetical protein